MTAADRVQSSEIVQLSREFNNAAERLPTLWSLTQDFESLITLLEDPDADPVEIEAEMQRLAGDIRAKAHGVATVIHSLEGLSAFQKEAATRLAAKARANQAHADRLRSYALTCMQTLGEERLEAGYFTLAIRKNNPSVTVVDEALIPDEFWRHPEPPPPEVNKLAILQHVKVTGEVPDGVEIERKPRLSIS